jgi:HPt (histidine-containing phosphotransfer) domain-containing protein
MDSYLSKPLNMDMLLALVATTVESGSVATEAPPVGHGPAEIMIDRAVLDELAELGELGDPDFLGDLIDQFVRETEPRLVELREALEGADALAAGRISRLIQGSACQLGGRRLALSCDRLEGNARAGLLSEATSDLHGVEFDYEDLRHRLMQLKATFAEEHVPRLHV